MATCAVCRHRNRPVIDGKLNAEGVSVVGVIAETFGFEEGEVREHLKRHGGAVVAYNPYLPDMIMNSLAEMDSLLEMRMRREGIPDLILVKMMDVRVRIFSQIMKTGKEMAEKQVELIPHWNRIKVAIEGVLRKHPKVRDEVDDALADLDVKLK